jgi:hypothetical protein
MGAFVVCKGTRTDRNLIMIFKVGGANGFESCNLFTGYVNVLLSDPIRVQEVYSLYGPWNCVSIAIVVLKTPWSRCVSCSNNTYSGDTGRLWCTDCASGKYLLESATECADIALPLSKPSYCQDYDGYTEVCLYFEQNQGQCLNSDVCLKCCSTYYDECCVQGDKCACAPGKCSDIDSRCKSCPVNSNLAMGRLVYQVASAMLALRDQTGVHVLCLNTQQEDALLDRGRHQMNAK